MRRAWLVVILLSALSACAIAPSPVLLSESNPERYVIVTLRNPAAPGAPRAGSTIRAYQPPSSYSLTPATRASAKAVATTHSLREAAAWPIGLLGVHCVVFELPSGVDRDQTLERLRRDGRVESAQALQSFHTLSTIANDPYRGLQRNLDVMDIAGAHGGSRGEGVRVAIIDTGVDASHPDLVGRIAKQADFVDDATDQRLHDRHGTAVAGVIAAVDNNQEGIVGVAPAAKLYDLRACWPEPRDGGRAACSTLTLAKAIAAAIEAQTEIINLSLTGPADPLLARLVGIGLDRGLVFVGATPPQSDQNSFPTGIKGVIGVDVSGGRSSADSALFAPGNEVLTLVPDGRYDFLSGSSLAAASVSGGIALLLARSRDLRATEAKEILVRSSRSLNTPEGVWASVNLCVALAALVPGMTCKE